GGYVAANIYMLVIGIIAINFLPYYVQNGVTRKNYFIGNVFAGVGLSIVIPVLIYIISFLEKSVINNFTSIVLRETSLEMAAEDVTNDIDRKSTTSELQSRFDLVCRLLLEKKKKKYHSNYR